MAVEARPRNEFTVEEIRAGKRQALTREQLEQRWSALEHAAQLAVKVPPGYVEATIRSGRDDPEGDGDPRLSKEE